MAFGIQKFRLFFTLVLSICLVLGIVAVAAAAGQKLQGTWGGERVIMKVNDGGAELEFECATGRISQAIQLDSHGDFELPGSFTPEGHGPVRGDGNNVNQVKYQGHVQDKTMTLTVIAGDEKLGPYSLSRDSEPILKKCR